MPAALEFTQDQWVALVGSDPSANKEDSTNPVEQVNFDDVGSKWLVLAYANLSAA